MISSLFNNITKSPSNRDNVEQIGDNLYSFNLNLFNGSSRVGIKFGAVEDLQIVDDLRYFYVYGTLIINYNNDILEAFESFGNTTSFGKNDTASYQFRGDGRDILEIDIMPQIKEERCLKVYASEGERKKYNIKHTCVIYKYEDITTGRGQKQRKFYFWDQDFQILNEVNINFSTADKNKDKKSTVKSGESTVEVSKSNTDNSMYTGDAIKEVLKIGLETSAKFKISFGKWEQGQSKILYYSPSNNKAINDITYLLSFHISDTRNNNLPSLLKKERYTDKYNLIPINDYYRGGSGVGLASFFDTKTIEDFYIGKIDPSSSGLGKGIPKTLNFSSNKANISDYNLIEDYSFVKINAKDLQKYLSTYVVHSNDPRGFFNSDLKQNNFKSAEKVYSETFLKSSSNRQSSSILPTNKLRKDNKSLQHTYVPESMDKFQRKSFGVNKGMLNLFFKNSSITFKARGNTIRQTGKFFTINRADSNISNSYDNTILGKYLITYIIHQFKMGSYYNTIHGVKPYTNDKTKFVEAI